MIVVRNAAKSNQRIDDVTIERVQMTREEFSKSLYEYEKHTNELKMSYEERQRRNREPKLSKKDDKLELNVSMADLERDLLNFKMGKRDRKEMSDQDKIRFEQDLEEIWKLCLEASSQVGKNKTRAEVTSNKTSTDDQKNRDQKEEEPKDLFKWEEVNKKANQKSKQTPKIKSLDSFNQLYSNYFVQYSKNYLKQFYMQ